MEPILRAMAATSFTNTNLRSTTHVFKRCDDDSKFFFRDVWWNFHVDIEHNNIVTFTVKAIPRLGLRRRRYARTITRARISVEILEEDGSSEPAAIRRSWADHRVHGKLANGTAWIMERIHVERTECSACGDDNFTFRCTVSEDPGIFSKFSNCWK